MPDAVHSASSGEGEYVEAHISRLVVVLNLNTVEQKKLCL